MNGIEFILSQDLFPLPKLFINSNMMNKRTRIRFSTTTTLIVVKLSLILHTLQLDAQKSNSDAYSMYKSLNKSFIYTLEETPHQTTNTKKENILISHYIKYVQEVLPKDMTNPSTRSKTPNKYKGLLSLIAVNRRAVYKKSFSRSWQDSEYLDGEEETLKPLKEFESPITAAHLNKNDTLLTLAFKNLTVEVIDLQSSEPGEVKSLTKFNAAYKFGSKKEGIIRSIGWIKYTSLVLFSPNRFQIIKLNRISSNNGLEIEVFRARSPLDSVGHIAFPESNYGPFLNNSNVYAKKWLSSTIIQLAFPRSCVLTGYDDPQSAVFDWTSMKAVRYWTDPDQNKAGSDDLGSIVNSIAYFGAVEEANLYLYSVKGEREGFKAFSLITGDITSVPDGVRSAKKVVGWVKYTVFVSVFAPDLVKSSNGQNSIFLVKFYGTEPERYQVDVEDQQDELIMKTINLAKIYFPTGDFPLNFENLFLWKHGVVAGTDFDAMYLQYFMDSHQRLVVKPPGFGWDFCRGEPIKPFGDEEMAGKKGSETSIPQKTENFGEPFKMFYGRFRYCSRCQSGFKNTNNKKRGQIDASKLKFSGETVNSCQPARCSKQGEKLHIETLANGEVSYKCLPEYKMYLYELDYNNKNGCHPGFNLDIYGLCRQCPKSKRSDCFLFSPPFADQDYITLNPALHSSKDLKKEVNYKGQVNGFIFGLKSFRDLFYSQRDTAVYVKKQGSQVRTWWKFQKSSGLQECYRLYENPQNRNGYSVSVGRGYTLKKMKDFPWIDFSKQKYSFENGTLSSHFCFKECPVGSYYDFESVSCRKCNLGCSVCSSFKKCQQCLPGLSEIKVAKFHEFEKEGLGQCMRGCQEGFYVKRFNGACLECEEGCNRCRDRASFEKLDNLEDKLPEVEKSNKIEKNKKKWRKKSKETFSANSNKISFCLECKKTTIEDIFVDTKKGICTPNCQGMSTVIVHEKDRSGKAYLKCDRCFDPNCETCMTHLKNGCIECKVKYTLQPDFSCYSPDKDPQMVFARIAMVWFLYSLLIGAGISLCLRRLGLSGARIQESEIENVRVKTQFYSKTKHLNKF